MPVSTQSAGSCISAGRDCWRDLGAFPLFRLSKAGWLPAVPHSRASPGCELVPPTSAAHSPPT